MTALKAFFDYAGHSALATWVGSSRYYFPAFEMMHLIGLTVLLGSILLFNLRFFGIGLRQLRLSEIAQDFAPWTRLSLILMVLSGIPLFCSKAFDLWGEEFTGFAIKMSLIAFSVIFYYMVQVPLARHGNLSKGRAAAVLSLGTWFGAAIAGLTLEFL